MRLQAYDCVYKAERVEWQAGNAGCMFTDLCLHDSRWARLASVQIVMAFRWRIHGQVTALLGIII